MLEIPLQQSDRRQVAKVKNFAAPSLGWVDESSVESIDSKSALILRNFVPYRNRIEARLGSKTINSVGSSCETLISYISGASNKLIAGAAGNLWTVPIDLSGLAPVAPTMINAVSGEFTNNRWQSVAFTNAADEVALIMVNGANGIQRYNHTTGLTLVTPTPSIPTVSNVTSHKGRLWFLKDKSANAYYGNPLSNAPTTLTEFPVGPFLKKGGWLVCIESWSKDGGAGPDDFLVFVSNLGEIVIYSGIDPADDFNLVGTFVSSPPMGPRCLKKMANELVYYSRFGPQFITDVLAKEGALVATDAPIREHFINDIALNGNAFGWDFITCNTRSWIIFNVPILPPTIMRQYCINLDIKSWFEVTDWNMISLVSHDGFKFFGDSVGNIKVFDYGGNDDGNHILCDFMSTWNEFDTPFSKKFNLAQTTIKSNVIPEVAIDMLTNYVSVNPTSEPGFSISLPASPWDTSPWDTSPWSNVSKFLTRWFGVSGQGSVGAFRYRTNVLDNTHELYSYKIAYEEGEIL